MKKRGMILLSILRLCILSHEKGIAFASEDVVTEAEKQHVEKATDYGLKGRFQEAIAEYQKAIETNPRSEIAYLGLSGIYNVLKEYPKAESYCKKALEIDPDFAEAHAALGGIYIGSGQYQQAVFSCNKALEISPDNPEVYLIRGSAYIYSGRYEDAQRDVQRAKEVYQGQKDVNGVAEANKLLNVISLRRQK